MRLLYLIILGLSLVFIKMTAQSPINLTSSNFPGNNDTLRYSSVLPSATINYSQTGTNYNWDFSNLTPISQGLRSYKNAIQTPYAFYFLGFNEYGEKVADTLGAGPLTITNYYNYYKKQTTPVNAYVVDGSGMTFSSIPVPSYYSDKDELYMLPMSYPKYDSTTFKFSTLSSTLIPIIYSKTGYRVTKVDGWGTVTTPYGTQACLRVVTTQYSKDSIKNTIVPIPFGFANNQRSYQWLTLTSKIPFLEVSGNLVGANFTVSQIRYRDIYRNILSVNEQNADNTQFTFFPNPVKKELIFDSNQIEAEKIVIIDSNGKLVLSLNNSQIKASNSVINVEHLPPGLYHLMATQGHKQTNFKFIKQ